MNYLKRIKLDDWLGILSASLMISASATEITRSLVPVALVGGVCLGAVIAWIRFGE